MTHFFCFCSMCLFSMCLIGHELNWEHYKEETVRELPKFTGWCTEEKARLLMDFIYEVQPIQCVEIGVFGGSTTFPMVRALQFLDRGILYAVDSWSNQEAIAGVALQDPNRTWWAEVDLKRIQKTFLLTFTKKRLSKWCKVISKTSKEAFLSFQDNFFDMVYLDGNFSSQGALEDAQLALIKTKKGGYIWLNDSDSDSKTAAVAFLMQHCVWLANRSLKNHCILFQKP